ncbi:MAG: nitrilase-related carbon-nitrogen hydrolase [Arthrobacter sp.]
MAVIAVLQATGLRGMVGENLQRLARYAEDAAANKVDVLVTPELFATGYAPAAVSGTDGGVIREELARIAAQYRISLVGSTVEHRGVERHISASLFDPSGEELTRYRKSYLFGDEEQEHFSAGEYHPEVVNVAGLRVALAICYDIEFPEVARRAGQLGADAILIPTAVPFTGDVMGIEPRHYYNAASISTITVPSRSIENGLYIAYANHTEPKFSGLSCISSPYGNLLALGSGDKEELLVAEAHPDEVRNARGLNTYLRDIALPQ